MEINTKSTNILFVIPPIISIEEIDHATTCSIPLGVLSIASYVKKYNKSTNIKILDLNAEIFNFRKKYAEVNEENFINIFNKCLNIKIKTKKPDIIAISALFNSCVGYFESLTPILKEKYPEAIIITGGAAPTTQYEYILDRYELIDAVGIGEAEQSVVELIEAEDRFSHLETSAGWMTRNRVLKGECSTQNIVDNIDEIPFLELDLVDFDMYSKYPRYRGDMKDTSNFKMATMMISRGCPYRCVYCASPSIHGRKVRYNSIPRVLDDIKRFKEEYGTQVIVFEDDFFLLHKKRAMKILEEIANLDLTIECPNGLSIMSIDEVIADALKNAGLKIAELAVESGCERVLNELMNKPYTKLDSVRKVVKLMRERDIYVRANFIMGMPGETREEIFESIEFMKTTGFDWVAVYLATPIVGTALHRICVEKDLLLEKDISKYHYGNSSIKLEHSTPQQMKEWRNIVNLECNFVENYNYKNHFFNNALIGFDDVINKVPNHAFAYYFASKCHENLNNHEKANQHMDQYIKIIANNEFWRNYAIKFGMPVMEKNEYIKDESKILQSSTDYGTFMSKVEDRVIC